MESRGFLTRLFGLNSASASSKNSATVHSDKVQQHDLKQPESAAEGEDGKREGQAQEEKHDRTADGDEVETEKRNGDSDRSEKEGGDKEDERRGVGWRSEFPFPLRPEAEDCAFYLKTGTCKFGSNCKFNHPIQRKQQVASIFLPFFPPFFDNRVFSLLCILNRLFSCITHWHRIVANMEMFPLFSFYFMFFPSCRPFPSLAVSCISCYSDF